MGKKPISPRTRLFNGLTHSLLAVGGLTLAHAETKVWTGVTGGDMSIGTNWNPAAVPAQGDILQFSSAANLLLSTGSALGGPVGSVGLALDITGSQTGSLLIDGTARITNISIASGAGALTLGDSNADLTTINLAGSTWTNDSANAATISSDVRFSNTNAVQNRVFTFAGAGNWNVNTALGVTASGASGSIILAKSGTGTVTLNTTATSALSNLRVTGGVFKLSNGTVNVASTGGDSYLTNGAIQVEGGALNISGAGAWLRLSDTAGQTSSLTVSGGEVNVTNTFGLQVGQNAGTGIVTISGTGKLRVDTIDATYGMILAENVNATGILNLDGGTLEVEVLRSGAGQSKFYFNGGTLKPTASSTTWIVDSSARATEIRNGGAKIDTAGFNVTMGEVIADSTVGGDIPGGFTKLGAGTLTLAGANTFTGATTVNAGTLTLSGSGALASTVLSVLAGATLDVSALSSYSLSGKTITLSLAGASNGFLNAGTLALGLDGAALKLDITTGALAASYDLYASGAPVGNLGSVALSGLFTGSLTRTGGTWSATSGGYNFSFDQNTGILSTVVAVPEPHEYAIAMVAFLGVLIALRRRVA